MTPNGARLSCGAELKHSQTKDYNRRRGAVSFRRWLGCAPTILARVSRGSAAWEPAQRFLNNHRTDVGRSQRCSDLTRGAVPASHETVIYLTVGSVRNSPVEFHAESGTDHVGSLENSLCS